MTENLRRERDAAHEQNDKSTDALNRTTKDLFDARARIAELEKEWKERGLEIGEARCGCLNAHYDLGSPEWGKGPTLQWPRKAARQIEQLQREREEARAQSAETSRALAENVERLTEARAAGYAAGQEAMRERAAVRIDALPCSLEGYITECLVDVRAIIRALPVEGE